jgi:Flp pilus assembly protein TadG
MAFRAALGRVRFGRRFTKDKSGLSALEFALILPIMVVLYLGGFEVSEAFMINRKVTHATSVLGDLVAQSETISDAEMDNILDAVSAVMNPYPIADMWMIVSGVSIDDQGVATVAWSDARNTSPLEAGAILTLPEAVSQPNTFIVVAEVHYAYTPTFGHSLTGVIDLADLFYLRPRLQNEVQRV